MKTLKTLPTAWAAPKVGGLAIALLLQFTSLISAQVPLPSASRQRPATRLDGSPGSPIGAYERADELRKAGHQEEALKAINTAIFWDSECGKCFGLRSGIHFNLGNHKEGISDGFMGEQLSTTPREKAMSAYNKGLNMSRLGRSGEAISVFDDCIRYDDTYGSCFFGKGKTLVELGITSEALEPLERATELTPKHGPSWAYLAFARGGVGQIEESLEAGHKAVELAPADPRSYLARGYAHAINVHFEDAIADASKALQLDPARPNAHLLRAQALQGLGRNEEAERDFSLAGC